MQIDHIALYVNDLEAARDFFVQYFGASSSGEYHNKTSCFRSYFLSFSDGARLEIMNKPQMEDAEKMLSRTGFIHLAFRVGSKEKVDSLTEDLAKAGYPTISGPRTTGDGDYESCIIGIEGNQIEITVLACPLTMHYAL
jgi:lactoylglutathione lyase